MSLCLVDIHGDIEGDYDIIKDLPRNATNGDVIKALFPNYRTDEMSHSVWVGYDDMSFRREWWNAPYRIESEE